MTPRELMEHELAWYKGIAKLKLLGHWSVRLGGKRLTVVVYLVRHHKKPRIAKKKQHRLAISYGQQILTSLILDNR